MATSKIDEIYIQNFKFFPKLIEPIKLGGNHLLLYGENGSGKSSIYWALYTLLECANKTDDSQIKKYFNPDTNEEERLINVNCPAGLDSYIKVKLIDETEFNVSYADTSINKNQKAQESNYSSDFITYRNLLSLYNFAHSDEINLMAFFSYAIFPYVKFSSVSIGGKAVVSTREIFKYVDKGLSKIEDISNDGKLRYPKEDEPEYEEYYRVKKHFQKELKSLLLTITTEGNRILKDEFKHDFSFSLSLEQENENNKKPKFAVRLKIPEYQGNRDVVYRPHSFLNEAKLTALGLAVRLAVLEKSLSPNSKLNLLVLDDLLISLDMSNRDKILELILKEYANKYQLFILTHDKNFFEFTRHKIQKMEQTDWKYKEMYSTDTFGIMQPYIKQSDTYLDKAEKYFHLKEYEIAGNFLRKEAELFCKEFMPKKYHYTIEYNLHDLNGLISECKKFAIGAGLDKALFKELDNHRKCVLNPASHDSYDVLKFYSEIDICIKTLKDLRNIQNEKFCDRSEEIEFTLNSSTGDKYTLKIKLEDDFRLLKEPSTNSVISKGMINYFVIKNGISGKIQYKVESIQKLYKEWYAKSDHAKPSDFWEGIIISKSRDKLITLRKF